MSDSYWNYEDDENIVCPYCGKEYEPSYEDTYIGGESADCYTEDTEKPTLVIDVERNSPCMAIRRDGNIIQKLLTEKQQMKK